MFTILSLGGRILGYSYYSLPIFYFIFLHFCNKHCAELWMVGKGDRVLKQEYKFMLHKKGISSKN